MTKKILITGVALMFAFVTLIAQDNVGFGTTTPHSSALLDMTSNNKGLLIPRVELVAVTNGTIPVNGPATGLLVFNASGSLEAGFYYWDGTKWVKVGAGGAVPTCTTLEEAYNCNTAGAGRTINATSGAVEITLPAGGTSTEALYIESNKGTLAAPTAGVYSINNNHGAGIYGELINTSNLYSGVQGITNSAMTGADLSTGVSGYHEGTGVGVGVWGEAGSNNAASASYGVYGRGTLKTFGGYFYGANFPGGFIETGDVTGVALQVAAANQSPLNPGFLNVGWAQILCGNSGSATSGNNIIFNNAAGEATMAPDMGGYNYLGTPSLEWWGIYSSNVLQTSRRELKRDITYFDENISNYVMDDIMKLKPTFYKYKAENDTKIAGKEQRTRYNMHLGFILDETPDYIQDNAFSGIDLYSLTSLGITGVQENRKSINSIEEQLSVIQDFGIANLNGNEIHVSYNKDFSGLQPIVSVTPHSPVKNYYVKSQDENGFVIAVEEANNFKFNWIAVAQKQVVKTNSDTLIDPILKSKLEVDEAQKADLRNQLMHKGPQKTIELKGKDSSKMNAKKFKLEKE